MRTLHSVGDTLARPGESVQDVIDRREWGENGPFYGRVEFLVKRLEDPSFCAKWTKGGQSDEEYALGAPERLKFLMAAQEVLGLVLDNIRKGDLVKAQKYIDVFNEKLKLPYTMVTDEGKTTVALAIPGSLGLSWKLGPNLPD